LRIIAFCTAYVTVTVQSRLASADRSLEEAAMDLGYGPVRALHRYHPATIAPAFGLELAAQLYAGRSTIFGDIELPCPGTARAAAHGDSPKGELGAVPMSRARQL